MKIMKGFTLVELTITMAISVIVAALVFSASLMISDYVNKSQTASNTINELNTFSSNVNDIFNDYQLAEYSISVSSSNDTLLFHSATDDSILTFQDGSLYKNDVVIQGCKYIKAVDFFINETLVKCIAHYGNDYTYTIILNKRV